MFGLKFNPFKSLTFWGTLSMAVNYVWNHVDPSAFSSTAWAVIQAISGIVGAVGVRNAIAKGPTL